MESIIKDTVMEYLDMRGFYDSCQHGFVKGRSTLTNLLETLDSWTRLLHEGFGIDLIGRQFLFRQALFRQALFRQALFRHFKEKFVAVSSLLQHRR